MTKLEGTETRSEIDKRHKDREEEAVACGVFFIVTVEEKR
jgi:hypothetical protein